MSFFYDLNKKLDSIRATPEVTHKQLNERDMSRAAKGIMKYGKDGMQALRNAEAEGKALGPVRKKYDKYADDKVNEMWGDPYHDDAKVDAINAANPPKTSGTGMKPAIPVKHHTYDRKDVASNISGKDSAAYDYRGQVEEGPMDAVKKIGKKVAGGINRLVGHGSDEEMRKDLQRKSGAPVTGKKPNFADKIANAKKEVDEMLGDVAAEAMRSALSPKQKKIAGMAGDPNKIGADDLAALRKGRKPEMDESAGGFTQADWDKVARKKRHLMTLNPNLEPEDAEQIAAEKLGYDYEEVLAWIEGDQNMEEAVKERSKGTAFDMSAPRAATPKVGSVERGHKHDIKHTATGRIVTRRTDDQGNSVGADDDSDADAGPRGRGRPKGTKGAIGAKGPSGKSKLMTKEGDQDITDQGEYDQEGDMAKDDIKTIVRHAQALSKVLGDNDNLPEWVQSKLAKIEGMMISIDEYMQNQESDDEEPIAEKAVSKQQQKFMGMAHAMQKGEKVKGASKELKKVASTMKPKDTEDFAKTKHKGLPDKAKSKKKEEDVEESTTSGSVASSTAAPKGGGMSFGKGIYDSMNRELENMIAESMSINMSDSTEGGKSLTITATDEDAMKLGMMLKNAGLGGGDAHGGDMHSHGEEACDTCGMQDCGCGDVQEAVDENSPDWPTNTEKADNNFGYSGGLNKPKADVAGNGQSTVPVVATRPHNEDDDMRRMMEMAGIKQAELEPWKETMKEEEEDFFHNPNVPADKQLPAPPKEVELDEAEEDTVEESIQRMREMAGIQEAKKQVDQNGDGKNDFEDIKIARMKASGAIDDKEEKKVDESIFALTNQWKAYKG